MSFLRRLTNGLIYSNAWVAFCLAVLVIGYAHYHCITDCLLYGLFTFLGTYTTYNFHRLVRESGFQQAAIATGRGHWMRQYKQFTFISSGIATAICIGLLFVLPVKPVSFLLLGLSGMIVLFYVVPVPFINRTLRAIPGFKNTWIVLVWVTLVSIPLLNRGIQPPWADLLLIAVLIFTQIIPFDIRDYRYDPANMKTLPQLMGIFPARIIGSLLLLLVISGCLFFNGFNAFLLLAMISSLSGLWWKQTKENILVLEFLWEVPLLFLGLFYYLLPCLPS